MKTTECPLFVLRVMVFGLPGPLVAGFRDFPGESFSGAQFTKDFRFRIPERLSTHREVPCSASVPEVNRGLREGNCS